MLLTYFLWNSIINISLFVEITLIEEGFDEVDWYSKKNR